VFEIGNSLREARVRQGLDYPQVELGTKIRAKYIRALEDEQFDILPGETYTKGFLRSYAEYLGLDGQIYVDEYSTRHNVAGFDDMPQRRPQTSVRARRDRAVERRIVLLALAGIAALTALVIVAWRYGGGEAASPPPSVPARTTAAAPVGLRFVGTHRGTYLVVRRGSSTGRVVFQGTVRRGDDQFVAGSRFWLYVRRPSGAHFTLRGKPVSLPSRRNLKVVVTPSKTARTP